MWHKRLLTCVDGCGTFIERTASIAPRAVWSRAAARSAVAMSEANAPIDTIRKSFGVGWDTVVGAVTAAADQLAAERPTRVGSDETVMVTGRLTKRRRQFLTALVCLDTSLVVAVAQGRDRASAAELLAEHAPDATMVACDLFPRLRPPLTPSRTRSWSLTCSTWSSRRCKRWMKSADTASSRSTATGATRTTRGSSSVGSCASARNASTR